MTGAALAARPLNAATWLAEWTAGPATKQLATSPLLDRGFATVTRIADGVYATFADSEKGPQCISNGGVIVGRKAVFLVEGHMQPEGAALEIEAARALSQAPIVGAVDTHYHLDHTFGNLGYAQQHIPILAHEQVTPLMKERYAALQGVDKAPLLAPWEQRLAQAQSEIDKAHKTSDLDALKWMFDSIDAARLAYPTESLAASDLPRRVDLGGLTAVIEFHPGHTTTDLIVRVPERNIVFTGDLLFNRYYPVSFDADMAAWRKVLDRFARYGRRTQFVPGHGPVGGVEVVREQAALMDDLHAHAEKMMQAGVSAEEAADRYVVPERFSDYVIFSWDLTVGGALRSYFAAWAATSAKTCCSSAWMRPLEAVISAPPR